MAKRILMATAAVLALGVFGVSAASAATLTVCESGPPTCGYSNIQSAVNAASSGDTIEIAAGTYTQSSSFGLDIEKNLTLEGAGAERTIINKGFVGVFGSQNLVVTITAVTIANGEGVSNEGTLTLSNSVVKNNLALQGAGIFNEGTLTLNNSTVSDNSATHKGGGISNERGTMTLHNSTVSDNSAESGGGIDNESGAVTLSNTKVSGNTAAHKGGGIYNKATVVGSNDTITGNSAPEGAGIFNEPPGEANLKNSKVQ